jgi:pimeloyl-ACP methyl ester carboxylesterase
MTGPSTSESGKKTIYLFSGLGADERAFQKLDLSGFEPVFIRWIPPLKNESIESYGARLLLQIPIPNPVLIGYSFGGIMAIEIGKLLTTEQIIIMASVKTRAELPPYFRLMSRFPIHKWLPASLIKRPSFLLNWLFGAKTTEDKKVLKAIIRDTDPIFLKWAMDRIISWQNRTRHTNLTHIHGDSDRVLPYRYVRPDITVSRGSHLMVLNQADELSRILKEIVKSR